MIIGQELKEKRENMKKKVEKKEYENRNRGFKMYVFVR